MAGEPPGFYTSWEVDMLRIALAITKEGTGWLRQHPELLTRVHAIPGSSLKTRSTTPGRTGTAPARISTSMRHNA